MKKRILAMALTAAMMLSLFPASVFALPESQPTASSSEIVAQLNESASGDSQPAASEKTNSEPTAASEKAASSEATSSEATSSEAVSSEATSSEAASSEAVSSEAAQAEGDISVASENGERKLNFWPFCPPKPTGQWVYVYTKVTGNTAGLVLNSDGYYTLGKVWVEGMPSPKKDLTGQDYKNALNKVKAALGGIERYKENKSIVLKDVDFGEKSLIREPNGAADYVEKGYTWHLDGKLDVKFYGTVTFKHVDQDTGNEFAKQTSDGTLYPAGTNLQFGEANAIQDAAEKFGYEYVDVEPTSYTVQGQTNKEITVKYKKVMTDVSYTVEYYKDNVQQTADTATISRQVWVKDAQTLAIDASAAPSATRYEGYVLEKVEPAYPTAGTMVPNGTVYKAYYKKVLTQLNTLKVEDIDPILYDGQEHKCVPAVTDSNNNALKEGTDYIVTSYTFDTAIDESNFKKFTDVSAITVTIKGMGDYTGEVKKTYQITPREVVLVSRGATKVYDGTPLTKPGVEVLGDGFVDGEINKDTLKANGTITEVGYVDNGITYNAVQNSNFKTANYTITYALGELRVVAQSIDPESPNHYKGIQITPEPSNSLYDGQEHKWVPTVTDRDGKTLTAGTDYDVAYDCTSNVAPYHQYIDVGDIKVTITGKGSYTGKVEYTYSITPREVILLSRGATKVYDGTPLTAPYDVPLGNEGFVKGEVSRIWTDAKVTNVSDGEVPNEVFFTEATKEQLNGQNPFNLKNYDIQRVTGTLSITPVKDIVVTITAPNAEHTYDGTAKYLDGFTVTSISNPTLYKQEYFKFTGLDTQDAHAEGINAGTYKMKLAPKHFENTNTNFENVTFKIEGGTLTITPATLTITTDSASKTYDGSDLTAKGYSIDGLVNGETVNFSITGRQKDVGSSDNTYVIDWNQSTAKQGNYTIVNKLGKLTVEARSGGSSSGGSSSGGSSSGGSSSTPTPAPEQAPTPTPVPVIVPATPTPAPTRVRRVAPAATATPAPTAKPTETIAESEPPKAESEPEVIEDEETPLAPMANGKWALVNLVLMILTVLASLLMLLGVIGKKRGRNNKSFWRIASLIPAIGALAAFVLTENMKLPMAMVDRWTLLMVIIAVLQLIVAAMSKKQNESEDDGANA